MSCTVAAALVIPLGVKTAHTDVDMLLHVFFKFSVKHEFSGRCFVVTYSRNGVH